MVSVFASMLPLKRRRPALVLGSAMIALVGVGSAMVLDRASATDLTAKVERDRFDRGYADLVETLLPAVVNVRIERGAQTVAESGQSPTPQVPEFFRRFFDDLPEGVPAPRGPLQGEGSGFIIDAEGFVVTNAHVVDGAETITVGLTGGHEIVAELIGVDAKTDLALLKIESNEDLPFVDFGDSDQVRVGDKVLAVGNPFGLGGTVTSGIISATGRQIGSGPYDDFLQIDAAINRGNSGGPAFNLDGEVIGVNSVIFSPSGGNVGIGFAISSNLAERIVEDLRDDGNVERGWLGVNIQTLDDDLAHAFGLDETNGALVSRVESGSPAAAAGIQTGDVILTFNDQAIEALSDLSKLVAATDPGSPASVEVWRDGEAMELSVDIGLMPAPQEMASLTPDVANEDPLGLTLSTLTDEQKTEAGLDGDQGGVLVTNVRGDSPAALKGLSAGDIVLRIGDRSVSSPAETKTVIDAAREAGEDSLLMLVHRDGGSRFIAVPLAVS